MMTVESCPRDERHWAYNEYVRDRIVPVSRFWGVNMELIKLEMRNVKMGKSVCYEH